MSLAHPYAKCHQEVMFDFTADLTGTGSWSVE